MLNCLFFYWSISINLGTSNFSLDIAVAAAPFELKLNQDLTFNVLQYIG